MTRMRKYRNAIVHGFGMDDFNNDLATDLINNIRNIITTATLDDGSNNSAAH